MTDAAACRLDAERHLRGAEAHYLRGAYVEAVAECRTALDLVIDESEPTGAALLVRVIERLLLTTEPWWTAQPDARADLQLAELVRQAERAADQAGDPVSWALARRVRGRFLLLTDNLERAIDCFADAVRHARQGTDRLVELEALADHAHSSIGRDFRAGQALLREAFALADRVDDLADAPLTRSVLARLTGYVGVAEFDAGHFDAGESALRQALATLHDIGARDQVSTMDNYLGQLLVAAGRFEEAEALLTPSADALTDFPLASTHRAYNIGLLGKLYVEWDRPADARPHLDEAWRQLRTTGNTSILPLVRNYRAEGLLHPDNPARDLVAAVALLAETVLECRRTGFQRSEVAALSLLAHAALERDDPSAAYEHSSLAITMLDRAGTMPALRTEEVFLVHARTLAARDDRAGARGWYRRARSVLDDKAASMATPEHRAQYLERVPVSRAIVAASTGRDDQEPEHRG